MVKKTGAVTLLLATFVVAAAHAQDPDRPQPLQRIRAEVVRGGFGMAGVERVMRLRDELKLTEAQISQLEEIRRQQVQRAQEMMELRSRHAAGQIAEETARAQIEAQNAQFRKNAEETQTRVDNILTQEQRTQLNERGRVYRARTPLRRELRVRERVLPGEFGLRLRPKEPGAYLRKFDRLDSVPRYYWFGTPNGDRLVPGKIRRRGVL